MITYYNYKLTPAHTTHDPADLTASEERKTRQAREPRSPQSATCRRRHNRSNMPSYTTLFLPLLASSATGFVAAPLSHVSTRPISDITRAPRLNMAIDYNDPAVMEEFNTIQMMEYDDVVEELAQSGVTAPADMGDMDVKLSERPRSCVSLLHTALTPLRHRHAISKLSQCSWNSERS